MAYKLISLCLFVAVVSQVSSRNLEGYATIEDIRLPDRTVNHLTNPLIGFGISIPHLILDTLEVCYVTFPNGVVYETFPDNNLPSSVSTGNGVFRACSIHFSNPPTSMSGIYELTALTSHFDGRRTIQSQRFDVRINEIEP